MQYSNVSPSSASILTPDEIVEIGEKIYFEKKEELEKNNFGQFIVIDVESGETFINSDKVIAIQTAQSKFPNRLFYIVQIGNLRQPSNQTINEIRKYGWAF